MMCCGSLGGGWEVGGWLGRTCTDHASSNEGCVGHYPFSGEGEGLGEFLHVDAVFVGGWVGGWVGGRWVEENEVVQMRCCGLGVGGWVGYLCTSVTTSSNVCWTERPRSKEAGVGGWA